MMFFIPSANSAQLQEKYNKIGIDKVVVELLKDGVKPNQIVEDCLPLDGLNPQNLIRALYCAGVTGQDVREAAENNDITEVIVVAGYKKSVDECRDVVEDSQAYTPVSSGPSFSSPTAGRTGGGLTFASPSAF
jgi:hypothetical protein